MDFQNIFNLSGKVAIVTGATGLLGKEHCKILYEFGAFVVALDIEEKKLSELVEELGDNALPIVADVSKKESLEQSLKKILSSLDHIDILVNNAAINDKFESPALAAEQSRFENYPLSKWEEMLQVNVTGVFLCCQVFGEMMVKRGYGSIINIASTYGMVAPDQEIYRSQEGQQTFFKSAAYCATKGAVISFTRFLSTYWGKNGVRVNSISPGGVENNQDEFFIKNYSKKVPLSRMASTTDFQGALIFLASDSSNYVTGSNLVVDGGWTTW